MKSILSFLLFVTTLQVLSQSQDTKIWLENAKIKVYIENERHYTKSYRDSLIRANYFVREKLIRTTKDTTYFSLIHFNKSLFATQYNKLDIACKNPNRKSLSEILKTSPYNQISAIVLVSFKKESDTSEIRRIPQSNGRVDLTRMFEQKRLTKEIKNNLIDVLTNYGNGELDVSFCTYEPRNAIVFLDKENNPIGYIELCFQCQQFKNFLVGIPLELCNEMFHAIQGFFMYEGIEYGMKYNERD